MNDPQMPLPESPLLLNTPLETSAPPLNPSPEMTKTSPTPPIPVPSSNLSVTRKDSLSPYRTKKALDKFEESVGGREAIIDALELATLGKKEEHFLRLLYDNARHNDSLAKIAKDSGLNAIAVLELFRTAAFAKAHAIVAGQLSDALPAVVSDIIAKSIDYQVICPSCGGNGTIEMDDDKLRTCLDCNGNGKLFKESDLDRQKIVLETTGVLKKGPGVAVQVNTQVNNTQPSSMFSKYVKSSDDTAYDVGSLEGEVVKDPS